MADLRTLVRVARRLNSKPRAKGLPALLFLTDPDRTPDPVAAAKRLPRLKRRELAVIYRHFGAPDRQVIAKTLRRVCARRGFLFLVGGDVALAARVRADGVHLPERRARRAAYIKRARPGWLVTVAAHNAPAVRAAHGADALLLSPVFPTRSPSAAGKKPLGALGFARLAMKSPVPAYALGGVSGKTARRSASGPAVGLAGIDAFIA